MLKRISNDFFVQVEQHFSPDFLTRSSSELKEYGKDWTRVFPPQPSAIAFPRSTLEVAQFLKLCTQYRIPVVPSGGRTGLAGGAVASQGEVVLNLSRMNQMGPVDTLAQTVRVQAGAVTEAVHEHCSSFGLTWPIDFASKGSSQVGGNISTNAGGVKVIRYGLTRQWILGLQVVTMQGEVLELNGALEKNNTGIDLRQLFIGSEGTLGIITEATLKLTKLPEKLEVFFFAVSNMAAVLKLFHEVRRSSLEITAFECLTENCFEIVTQVRGLKSPFNQNYPAYVLLEIESPKYADSQNRLEAWLSDLFEKSLVLDGTWAQSPREARELWNIREGISESLAHQGFVYKNDIALPVSQLENFVEEMFSLFAKRNPDFKVFLFGHIGDGNLHVNTMKPLQLDQDQFVQLCQDADQDLFALVKKYSGSISAEHGIGLLKKEALHFSRSPTEIALMRGLKQLFDPLNLLNPGKIFS